MSARTVVVSVRMTEGERGSLKHLADIAGLDLSSFLRESALWQTRVPLGAMSRTGNPVEMREFSVWGSAAESGGDE